jgi:hypothetical protein
VCVVCLFPHSTHKVQPLDVSFMGPFKSYTFRNQDVAKNTFG